MRRLAGLLLLLAVLSACSRPAETPPPAADPVDPGMFTASVTPLSPSDIGPFSFVDARRGLMATGDSVSLTEDGGRHWRKLSKVDGTVRALAFADTGRGWAATEKGLFASLDGGETWGRMEIPCQLLGVTPANGLLICADASEGGRLFRTNDGGKSWAPVVDPCGPWRDRARPSFIDARTGWMLCTSQPGVGMQGKKLYRTDDGGTDWRLVAEAEFGKSRTGPGTLSLGGYASGVFFLDEHHGWMTHSRGGLIATTDGGVNWRGVRLPLVGEQFLGPVQFVTLDHGYLVARSGGRPHLLATEDGGKTWTQVYPGVGPEPGAPLQLFSGKEAIAAGTFLDPGAILKTRDGGRTWEQVATIPGDRLTGLSFPDTQHGWVISETWGHPWEHFLYRTSDGGKTWERLADQARHISFVDARTGYIGGPDLLVTRDGGATFAAIGPFGGQQFEFITPDDGWGLKDFRLHMTDDGGKSWQEIPTDCRVVQFDLLPGGQAWALAMDCEGSEGKAQLRLTRDGGRTWTRFDLGAIRPRHVVAADVQNAWLIDELGHFYSTEDGGKTWAQVR